MKVQGYWGMCAVILARRWWLRIFQYSLETEHAYVLPLYCAQRVDLSVNSPYPVPATYRTRAILPCASGTFDAPCHS